MKVRMGIDVGGSFTDAATVEARIEVEPKANLGWATAIGSTEQREKLK